LFLSGDGNPIAKSTSKPQACPRVGILNSPCCDLIFQRFFFGVFMPLRFAAMLWLALFAGQKSLQPPPEPMKVDVDLVLVNAAVADARGRSVSGLDKAHFQLWEDKVQQEIQFFSSEEIPVSVGIIFDTSGSMRDKIAVTRDAVMRFLQTGSPMDEYTLIQFESRPQVAQDFTTNVAEIRDRLTFVSPSGFTSLYDAVYLGIEKLRHAHNPRKAILLLTDGEDNHSHHSLGDLKELAKESDVQIFAIGIPGYPTLKLGASMIDARKGSHHPGQDSMQELVDLTGGQAFFTNDVRKLDDICSKISEALRAEYVIGYSPTNRNKDGKWRGLKLKVNSSSHLSVHARRGYYARGE
jgi:Ca-activated chloride channel homolog